MLPHVDVAAAKIVAVDDGSALLFDVVAFVVVVAAAAVEPLVAVDGVVGISAATAADSAARVVADAVVVAADIGVAHYLLVKRKFLAVASRGELERRALE